VLGVREAVLGRRRAAPLVELAQADPELQELAVLTVTRHAEPRPSSLLAVGGGLTIG
jgi:hypothetical protein